MPSRPSQPDHEDDPTDIDFVSVISGFIILGVAFTALACCVGGCVCVARCCCRIGKRRLFGDGHVNGAVSTVTTVDGQEVDVAHLKAWKEPMTAYALWGLAGWFGAHHFYLDRLVHGMFCLWTINFFLVGWMLDMFLLPVYVRGANKGIAPVALRDGTSWRTMTRLPVIYGAVLFVFIFAFAKTPYLLHRSGLVDVECMAAGTADNPFDVLRLERGAEAAAAALAYRRELAKLEMLKTVQGKCDAKCKAAKEELRKAHDFVSGKTWRRSEEDPQHVAAGRGSPRVRRDRQGQSQAGDPSRTHLGGEMDDWAHYTFFLWKGLLDGFIRKSSKVAEKLFSGSGKREEEPEASKHKHGSSETTEA